MIAPIEVVCDLQNEGLDVQVKRGSASLNRTEQNELISSLCYLDHIHH